MGEQYHNGGSIDRLSAKTVGEIVLKVLKRKISDAAAWIDIDPHWIQAVQSGSIEGAGMVLIGSVQARVHVLAAR